MEEEIKLKRPYKTFNLYDMIYYETLAPDGTPPITAGQLAKLKVRKSHEQA